VFPLLVFIRICVAVYFGVLITYTGECYNTKYRVTGFGIATGIGGVAGVVMPWIVIEAMKVAKNFSFVIFAICCIFCLIATFVLKIDTTGKALDIDYQAEE